MQLKGSKTEQNLKDAFAGESQANRRYLYFAAKADVEGHNDVSTVFRSTAEGETGHAHGHLEFLEESGDRATGLPIGTTADNLKAALAAAGATFKDVVKGTYFVVGLKPEHVAHVREVLAASGDSKAWQSAVNNGRSAYNRKDWKTAEQQFQLALSEAEKFAP